MVQFYTGDCREVLASLEPKSVQSCVTSPPYFGLRSYNLPPTIWGGDPICAHAWVPRCYYTERSAAGSSSEAFSEAWQTNADRLKAARWREDATCELCGAWSGCLGLEPSVQQYVTNLVEVFRAVHRVLRDDGLLFVNLGDSYARDRKKGQHKLGQSGKQACVYDAGGGRASTCIDLPAKNLIGIPWRVTFALQDQGWILRNDCIWNRPNCLPESVRDRFVRSHEYVFMFSKQEKYFFDLDAAKEPVAEPGRASGNKARKLDVAGERSRLGTHVGSSVPYQDVTGKRSPRTVWTIPIKPTKEAHFAIFAPELVSKCLIASTPEGGCCHCCGSPFVRLVEKGEPNAAWRERCGADSSGGYHGKATKEFSKAGAQDASAVKARILAGMVEKRTVGWRASCDHHAPYYRRLPKPRSLRKQWQRYLSGDWWRRASRRPLDPTWPRGTAVVLDPFAGSGTVSLVAEKLGHDSIYIDQSSEYTEMAKRRIGIIEKQEEDCQTN